MTCWLCVSLPYATFALAVRDGRVVEAAPYAWAMLKRNRVGDDERAVADFFRSKGAVFRDLGGA